MKQRRLPRRELPEIRAQFIRMLEEGVSADAIKAALKLSRTTYFQWKRAYEERGAEGLKVRPIPGGVPKLTDQQTNQLFGWLAGRDPRQFQFDFAFLKPKVRREVDPRKVGRENDPQGNRKLVRPIGLAPQRAVQPAHQQ